MNTSVRRVSDAAYGYGRVYLGPEPEDGGVHEGYQGLIIVDTCGIWIDAAVERLYPGYDVEWEPLSALGHSDTWTSLVPWHQIYSIEFENGVKRV